MFNRNEERKVKEFKGTTIYLTKYDDLSVEEYLDRIVRSIERYEKQTGEMPEKLKLGYSNYERILNHNKNLIEIHKDFYKYLL